MAALLVGGAIAGVAWWLLGALPGLLPPGDEVVARQGAIQTALAAGAGVGAAITLMLTFRRQRHQEHAAHVTAHQAALVAESTRHDATERRVTDLYTKAVEQLGHEKAAVRLGGLYALERLAQDSPGHRQTIVNVICAYLRMPYTLPTGKTAATDAAEASKADCAPQASAEATHGMREEREIRLAAQHILSDHLCPQPETGTGTGTDQSTRSSSRFWDGIRLNLTGATLIDLDMSACRVTCAQFDEATFIGRCSFEGTVFHGETRFGDAVFPGFANFTDAVFHGNAWFSGASFHGEPGMGAAGFHDHRYSRREAFYGATFCRTGFHAYTAFRSATFHGDARFDEAVFHDECTFSGTVFHGDARFAGVHFNQLAYFGDEDFVVNFYPATTFCRLARFDAPIVTGDEPVVLEGVKTNDATAAHVWPPGWEVRVDEDGTGTLTRASGMSFSSSGGLGDVVALKDDDGLQKAACLCADTRLGDERVAQDGDVEP